MQKLKIVFVNHQKLERKLRRLKGDMLQGKEELQARIGEMHHSLNHCLQQWKQCQAIGAIEDALIFPIKQTGYRPRLLLSDLTK